jgi:ApbE superfamily uncharacterized protein (UPF0280 family)
MRALPQRSRLADGRLHLHDGPIDLIIEAFGERSDVENAYCAAWRRFATILDELCRELPLLRARATPTSVHPAGVVARRMADAVAPLCIERFITPMAAVAGSVAEEVLSAMIAAAPLRRGYVNNGGDIALHLVSEESFVIGMVDRPDRPSLIGHAKVTGYDAVRGVATSGWRGRSFSLGIADAVTVLARSASVADAAATLVANAVDLPGHPAISRAPAHSRDPQSDLGGQSVTIDVGRLTQRDIAGALSAGLKEAERLRRCGTLAGAALQLRGQTLLCGLGDAQSIGDIVEGISSALAENVSQSVWHSVHGQLGGSEMQGLESLR